MAKSDKEELLDSLRQSNLFTFQDTPNVVLQIQTPINKEFICVFGYDNITAKADYIEKAYNDDLELKNNPQVKIISVHVNLTITTYWRNMFDMHL